MLLLMDLMDGNPTQIILFFKVVMQCYMEVILPNLVYYSRDQVLIIKLKQKWNFGCNSIYQIRNNLMNFGGLQMYLDGMKIYNRSYNNDTIISLNGPTPFNQYYDIIIVKYPQKKKTAFIYIDVTGLSSCGIRIFQFYIERCPQGCDVCDNYDFLACKKWRIFMLNFDQYQFSNLQGWSTELSWNLQQFFICGQCHFLRQYQIQYTGVLSPHKGLMVKFFRIFDIGSQIILINGVEYLVQQPTVFYQIELIINQHIDQKLSITIYSRNQYIIQFIVKYPFYLIFIQLHNHY
ncbi:unnamed protein product [Paramecium primaurelia]|uniref:Transmembrane protein n=1 Tax=Paramecium primaurelia TaxID=5886 RepID=A0A8S1M407_PARPR|nr:unnamed protein product [Paramecium primaurelia]